MDVISKYFLVFCLVCLPFSFARAQEAPAEEETPWRRNLSFSFLATSGNTDTSSMGLKLEAVRRPEPWGLEIKALANRAEENNETNAERFFAGVRTSRAVKTRTSLFAGVSFEQDEFAGIDLRSLLEIGMTFVVEDTEKQTLRLDTGFTWTDEDRVEPEPGTSDLGAVLGLRYERKISETASFLQTLAYYPNFDESGDWRAESATALTAALTDRLAVQLGYEVRYRNLPVGQRDDTDSSTKASVIWNL